MGERKEGQGALRVVDGKFVGALDQIYLSTHESNEP